MAVHDDNKSVSVNPQTDSQEIVQCFISSITQITHTYSLE